jgi:hypothetical protein
MFYSIDNFAQVLGGSARAVASLTAWISRDKLGKARVVVDLAIDKVVFMQLQGLSEVI